MQVPFLGRAPRTKETLLDFLKWSRVTRPPLVFRGLTGSQRTPGFWGVTIRMVLAITVLRNLEIHQMNIKTAFLNGELDEEIYIEQPEGFSTA